MARAKAARKTSTPTDQAQQFTELLGRIASGAGVSGACEELGIQYHQLVAWVNEDESGKRKEAYRDAQAAGVAYRAHQLDEELADDSNDFIEVEQLVLTAKGPKRLTQMQMNHPHLRRLELRLRSTQWMAARLNRDYNERLINEHQGGTQVGLVIGDSAAVAEAARKRREKEAEQ